MTKKKPVAEEIVPPAAETTRNLFITVETYDDKGVQIGTRIVDMYHPGTRNWLPNHFWWAMHNGHLVEVQSATEAQVAEYVEEAKLALAEKYMREQQAASA